MSQIPVEAVVVEDTTTEYPQDAQGSEELDAELIPPPPPLVRQYRLEADLDLEPPRKKARVEDHTHPLLELPPGDYIVRVSLRDISIQRLWVPHGTPVEIIRVPVGDQHQQQQQ